jgi:N-acetylglucosaminyl-diphospho-decaprenol L-rhamnosyltransferase
VPSLLVLHFPEPAGRDPRGRRRLETRNRVLTALLRRPPTEVARTAMAALRAEPAALGDVLRHLPWALGRRRRLPATVEDALRRLAD